MKYFDINTLEEIMKLEYNTFWSKGIEYIALSSAFDIETSSFRDIEDKKVSLMYVWQFGIEDLIVYGRTWEEFVRLIGHLRNIFELSIRRRLIIYIHNLSFEMQFMKHYFNWEKVFALDKYKPIYAVTEEGIEFRCSYIESNMALSKLPTKVKKLVGDLDYKLIRTPETPLTEKELGYCENDIAVLLEYIKNKGLKNMRLTSTSYVREKLRNALFYGYKGDEPWKIKRYKEYIQSLYMDMEFFKIAREVFSGGFTHANASYVGETLEDVISFDLTSAYPSVMVYCNNYPITRFQKTEITSTEEFNNLIKTMCCFFRIELTNIKSKCDFDHYIQVAKIIGKFDETKALIDNGRLVEYSGKINMSVSDVDWSIIRETYDIEKIQVYDMYTAHRGYLPRDFIMTILDMYSEKTKLKDVSGKEEEYAILKALLNALYGMCVTNPIQKDIILTDEYTWVNDTTGDMETLSKYNMNNNRFLYYPWGIYVTANVRRIIWDSILYVNKERHIYSDTDSCKLYNTTSIIEKYNRLNDIIATKLHMSAKANNFDKSLCYPKNKNGEVKPLGFWECDGYYKRFKTLGAKRYILLDSNNKLKLVVAGLNKEKGKKYLENIHSNDMDNVFKHFQIGLKVPADKTGKLTHTYIEEERRGVVKDYLGNYYEYKVPSGVHLEDASFEMRISKTFAEYLLSIAKNKI